MNTAGCEFAGTRMNTRPSGPADQRCPGGNSAPDAQEPLQAALEQEFEQLLGAGRWKRGG